AFALHLLFQDTKRLIDVVVTNEYLQGLFLCYRIALSTFTSPLIVPQQRVPRSRSHVAPAYAARMQRRRSRAAAALNWACRFRRSGHRVAFWRTFYRSALRLGRVAHAFAVCRCDARAEHVPHDPSREARWPGSTPASAARSRADTAPRRPSRTRWRCR